MSSSETFHNETILQNPSQNVGLGVTIILFEIFFSICLLICSFLGPIALFYVIRLTCRRFCENRFIRVRNCLRFDLVPRNMVFRFLFLHRKFFGMFIGKKNGLFILLFSRMMMAIIFSLFAAISLRNVIQNGNFGSFVMDFSNMPLFLVPLNSFFVTILSLLFLIFGIHREFYGPIQMTDSMEIITRTQHLTNFSEAEDGTEDRSYTNRQRRNLSNGRRRRRRKGRRQKRRRNYINERTRNQIHKRRLSRRDGRRGRRRNGENLPVQSMSQYSKLNMIDDTSPPLSPNEQELMNFQISTTSGNDESSHHRERTNSDESKISLLSSTTSVHPSSASYMGGSSTISNMNMNSPTRTFTDEKGKILVILAQFVHVFYSITLTSTIFSFFTFWLVLIPFGMHTQKPDLMSFENIVSHIILFFSVFIVDFLLPGFLGMSIIFHSMPVLGFFTLFLTIQSIVEVSVGKGFPFEALNFGSSDSSSIIFHILLSSAFLACFLVLSSLSSLKAWLVHWEAWKIGRGLACCNDPNLLPNPTFSSRNEIDDQFKRRTMLIQDNRNMFHGAITPRSNHRRSSSGRSRGRVSSELDDQEILDRFTYAVEFGESTDSETEDYSSDIIIDEDEDEDNNFEDFELEDDEFEEEEGEGEYNLEDEDELEEEGIDEEDEDEEDEEEGDYEYDEDLLVQSSSSSNRRYFDGMESEDDILLV